MSEWIPSKYPPEDDRKVLIWWTKSDSSESGWIASVSIGKYLHVLNQWRPTGCNGDFSDEVTHWMDFPEPPK